MNIKASVLKNFVLLLLIAGCNCQKLIAATFTVSDNTWANTAGSLLWCINQANASAGPHLIDFNPAGAPYTIQATGQINLNQLITLDGSTSGQIVTLDGTNALNTRGISVNTGGAGSIIRGLFITQYDFDGIYVFNSSAATIGGDRSLGYGNIISGNGQSGIRLENSPNNIVQGNYIGLNQAGNSALANGQNGIWIMGATTTNTLIGGANANFRNVISGNLFNGITITDGINVITSNYIGTSAAGDIAIGNGQNGISINTSSTTNTIGGNSVDLRNIISANGYNGISVGSGTSTIQGNYIGTDITGLLDFGNAQNGISFSNNTNGNLVGGTNINQRNVISGNNFNGIRISTGSHTISGNYIGVAANGTSALGNSQNGINFVTAGNNNIIGGLTAAERNVISANTEVGIRSNNTLSLKIFGNIIGLDALGLNKLGNGIDGIYGRDSGNNHEIGGATTAHRNIISGNGRDGIFYEVNNTGLLVQGNYIGTDINGRAGVGNLGNSRNGVFVNTATTAYTISDNLISGNGLLFRKGQGNGSGIMANSSSNYTISNNILGLEVDGLVAYGNYENGINMINSGTGLIRNNTVSSNGSWQVDGTTTSASPVAGNLPFGHGIVLNSSNTVSLFGNKVGVNINGEGDFGNLQSGMIFIFGDNFTIGSTLASDRNIIGNNLEFGIHFVQVGANVTVKNNYIGQSASGLAVGNDGGGIFIDGANNSSNLIVGGSLANEANVIANTTGDNLRFASGCGVCVGGNSAKTTGIRNLISQNSITCNFGLGIDLDFNADMYDHWSNQWWGSVSVPPVPGIGNIGKAKPTVDPYRTSTSIVSGTGISGDRIQIFDNTCDCEGEKYLSSTTVTANGTWSATLPFPVIDSTFLTAIAIDANNNTSEFTACCRVQSDTLKLTKDSLCLGEAAKITLSYHVGLSFQLQTSTSASGPWANVGTAKIRADSIWNFTPTAVAVNYYRVISSAPSWGTKGVNPTCGDTSQIVKLSVFSTPNLVITNPTAVCAPLKINLTAANVTAGSTGNGTLSYWTNATATSSFATPSSADSGVYYIKSTNPANANCSDIKAVSAIINSSPVLSITNPTAVCAPLKINLTAASVTAGSTGKGTLTYWTNATATSSFATPNAADSGVYYIKSTNPANANCSDIKAVSAIVNSSPVLSITNPTAVCAPLKINLTAASVTAGSTGNGTLSYWTNATATSSFATPSAADSGVYYIKSTNPANANCSDIKAVSAIINSSPVLSITNPTAVCAPLKINLTAANVTAGSTGNGTLSYWTNATATSSFASPSAADSGVYYIKSTNPANANCSDIKAVSAIVNSSPVLSITNPSAVCAPLKINLTAANVTAGSTGNGTLSYWTNATATSSFATPSSADSGVYYIKSTNPANANCSDIKPVTAIVNSSPVLSITNPTAVCAPTKINLTAASVTAGSTGNGTLSYWTNATATSSFASPSAADSGVYYIKSTNPANANCSDIKAVSAIVNSSPVLSISNPNAVCAPLKINLTAASVTAGSTGNGTLSYWTNATATSSYASPSAADSGVYYIKSTNPANANCSDIKPVTAIVNSSPVLSISNPTAVCAPTKINLTAASVTAGSTGKGTLSYWTNATATSSYASPSAADSGVYYIKSTNPANTTCFDIKAVSASLNPLPVITVSKNDPSSCGTKDGILKVGNLKVGDNYNWSYNTNLPSKITGTSVADASGEIVLNSSLGSGSYTNIFVDLNGCISNNLSSTLTDPNAASIDAGTAQTACSGATISLQATNPDGATISWDKGVSDGIAFTPTTGNELYTVTADLAGCKTTDTVRVIIYETPILTINNPSAVCSPTKINLTGSGVSSIGTLSYWSDASATTPLPDETAVGNGTYYIKAENASDATCFDIEAVIAKVINAPTITSLLAKDPTNCLDNDGRFTINTSGGTTLEYSIDNGANYQSSNVFDNLSSTSSPYSIITRNTDASCPATATGTITAPSAPIINSITPKNPTNCSDNDGEIEILASGNSGTLEYSINNGTNYQTNPKFTSLSTANAPFTVRVRYTNASCEVNGGLANLSAPALPTITSINATNLTDCDTKNGSIKINASGPSGTIEYSIDGGQSYQASADFTNLDAGNYDPIVRYTNATCEVNHAPISLSSPSSPNFNTVAATNPSNCGGNNGTITINASGTSAFEYSINGSTFQSSPIFNNLNAGVYNPLIRYTDQTCPVQYGIVAIADPEPTNFSVRSQAPTCTGLSGKLIFEGDLIETKNYTISFIDHNNLAENRALSFENNAFEIGPYPSGSYQNFSLTDDKNCTSTYNIPVEIGVQVDTCPKSPIKAPNVFTANGDGYNETFEIFGLADYAYTQVYIYNRWGNPVYTSSNYVAKPWDGGKYPEGVYFFVIEYGTEETNKKSHTGVVHLLR